MEKDFEVWKTMVEYLNPKISVKVNVCKKPGNYVFNLKFALKINCQVLTFSSKISRKKLKINFT